MQIQIGVLRCVFQVIDQDQRTAQDPAGRIAQRDDRLCVSDQPGEAEEIDLTEDDEGS